MLDLERFVTKAEGESGQNVLASCSARRVSPGSFIGKAGLLCALDDGLAFVEDAIFDPGEVTTVPLQAIEGAELQRSAGSTILAVDTPEGRILFEDLEHDKAARIAEAARLPLESSPTPADGAPLDPIGALGPASAPSTGLPDLGPREPLSAPSEARSEDEPTIDFSTAQEATDVDDELSMGAPAPAGLLSPARDRGEPSEAVAMVGRDERPARSAKKRRRKGKAAAKRSKSGSGPYIWVAYVVPAVLALGGLLYHWSVAVLLGCIGYPLGLAVAERLHRKSKQR